MAAILGLNPWRTALDVYLEKIGEQPDTEDNAAMWWGRSLEGIMARRYAELTGLRQGELLTGTAIADAFPKKRTLVFGRGPDAHVLIRHKEFPFLLATVDGLVPSRERGLELKTANDFCATEWGEQGTDQVPVYYLTQCAHYEAVTDLPVWDVGSLLGSHARAHGDLALYKVERTRSLESEITDVAIRFWHGHVLKRIPPKIDGSSSWQRYLAQRYARSTGVTVKATARIRELAGRYLEAQRSRQAAEQQELLCRNELAAIIKHADKTTGTFGTIGWVRPGQKEVVDWEAVATAAKATPAQIRRHTSTKQDQAYVRAWWSRGNDGKNG